MVFSSNTLPLLLLLLSSSLLSHSLPYPSYCTKCSKSSPSCFDGNSKLPPLLPSTVSSLAPSIMTASAFIRHGSRTPYEPSYCWEGYQEDDSQSKWDCSTSMVMTTSPSSASPYTSSSGLLFRKVYDSLTPPSYNAFRGTCHEGQLIEEGVKQETANGVALREAYVGADEARNLFNVAEPYLTSNESSTSGVPLSHVRFRGDDQQRTLMSGQILVESMFPSAERVVVDWHTSDYGYDNVYPNANACPRLVIIVLLFAFFFPIFFMRALPSPLSYSLHQCAAGGARPGCFFGPR